MSLRHLEARIARLERAMAETKTRGRRLAFEFPIEPELANAIWDDWKRLEDLEMTPVSDQDSTPRFVARVLKNVPNTSEEIALRERIAERAKTIHCPPCYRLKEFLDDDETLPALLRGKENLLFWQHEFFIDNLDDVDAEKAQIVARMEAYKQTAEGQARFRLEKLLKKSGWKSEAEHKEIERLMEQYPEPLHHPSNPFPVWRPSLETLREDAERDRRIAERNKEQRYKLAQENKK